MNIFFQSREYTLSIGVLELSLNNFANWCRKSVCTCVLFVSFVGFGLTIVESVVVSVGRVSAVVVVVDEFVDVGADELACVGNSTVLCDTGSMIANGVFLRFSGCCCPVGAGCCVYGFGGCMFCESEGWGVGTFDWSI